MFLFTQVWFKLKFYIILNDYIRHTYIFFCNFCSMRSTYGCECGPTTVHIVVWLLQFCLLDASGKSTALKSSNEKEPSQWEIYRTDFNYYISLSTWSSLCNSNQRYCTSINGAAHILFSMALAIYSIVTLHCCHIISSGRRSAGLMWLRQIHIIISVTLFSIQYIN
jgi:hypothetical protein